MQSEEEQLLEGSGSETDSDLVAYSDIYYNVRVPDWGT